MTICSSEPLKYIKYAYMSRHTHDGSLTNYAT